MPSAIRITPTLLLALASSTALADGDLMTRSTLTGDWGGLRHQLEENGVRFTGDYSGAMGLHYVNLDLVFDGGELDPTRPEIVLYEPTPSGRVRITGADFLVIAKDWDDKHPEGPPPSLMGQLFHRFEAPNRFGLPAFYTLHVWAWKDSPTGTFVNWHNDIRCDGFKEQ